MATMAIVATLLATGATAQTYTHHYPKAVERAAAKWVKQGQWRGAFNKAVPAPTVNLTEFCIQYSRNPKFHSPSSRAPCPVRQSPFFNPQLVYGTPIVPCASAGLPPRRKLEAQTTVTGDPPAGAVQVTNLVTSAVRGFFLPSAFQIIPFQFPQILQKYFSVFGSLYKKLQNFLQFSHFTFRPFGSIMYKTNKNYERGDTMLSIFKIRDYKPQEEKPDVDDLIFGDDHDYVSTK